MKVYLFTADTNFIFIFGHFFIIFVVFKSVIVLHFVIFFIPLNGSKLIFVTFSRR